MSGLETLYLVDAVTSLGGMEIAMDKWGVDALEFTWGTPVLIESVKKAA